MSTKLIFRNGLKTIGGTIVELISNNNRLIFDFGTFYDPANNNQEIIPDIVGIYDGKSDYDDHIFISHLHLDHSKAMNLVHKDAKIYMHEHSKEMLNHLYQIEFDGFLGKQRSYIAIKDNKPLIINDFEITMMQVDHDVAGACAILFKNQDISLFYSGDIRLHGLNSEKTYQMIDFIQSLDTKIDVAIFEGVTVSFIENDYVIIPHNNCEFEQMEENFTEVIKDKVKQSNLILVNPYIMSKERLYNTLLLAKKLQKQACLTPKFAYLADKYFPKFEFKVLGDDLYNTGRDVILYDQLTTSNLAIFEYNKIEKYQNAISKHNTSLIQTGGEPLGSFDPNWQRLEEYCKKNQIEFIAYGASGHASPEHLLYIVEAINPTYLMPLHSFKPELLKSEKASIIQMLPVKDKVYEFKNHKLQ